MWKSSEEAVSGSIKETGHIPKKRKKSWVSLYMLRCGSWSWESAYGNSEAPRKRAPGSVHEGASTGFWEASCALNVCSTEGWGPSLCFPRYGAISVTTWAGGFASLWNWLVWEFGKAWNCRLDKPQSWVRRACGGVKGRSKGPWSVSVESCGGEAYLATENPEFWKGQITGTLQRETVWASSREGPRVCYKSQRLGSGDTCDHWSLYDSILSSSTPAWSFRGLHFPCCILIIFCYTCTSSWDRSVYSIPLCT